MAWKSIYSKTCVKRPLSKRSKIGFQDQLSLDAGLTYCRMLQGDHYAILSTFIKLPFVIKIFVLSILRGRFTQVLLWYYVISTIHESYVGDSEIWHQGYKTASWSTQLSMTFQLLTKTKLLINKELSCSKTQIMYLSCWYCILIIYELDELHAQLSWSWKSFITSESGYQVWIFD